MCIIDRPYDIDELLANMQALRNVERGGAMPRHMQHVVEEILATRARERWENRGLDGDVTEEEQRV